MKSDSRVAHSIPSLFNGVSQQAPTLRLPTQCELQDNAYSSIADGLRKRPPTEHIAKLKAASAQDAYVHLINRDSTEKYAVVVTNGDLEVFDLLTGATVSATFPDGKAYLVAATPRTSFSFVTIADTTIVVNKGTAAAMDTSPAQEAKPYEALVYIKKGVNSTTYSIALGGTTYSTTSAATGQVSTAGEAGNLKALIPSGTYTVTQTSSVLHIVRVDGADFTFSVSDSFGEQGMVGFKETAQRFSDLPARAVDGVRLRITGESTDSFDDYYVQYSTESGSTSGVWRESRGWGIDNSIAATLAPHKLVRQSDGTFIFSEITWADRLVGDELSAESPSFIGKKINDVFFYRNRLGFVADENIILSRAGDFWNFWAETVKDVLDTDPIDVAVSHVKVSILRHAIPFKQSLLLFSEQTQFQLTADGPLAPGTVKVDVTTEFESSLQAKPVGAGQNVFFSVEKGSYTGLREYFVDNDSASNDAANITAHVPRYFKANAFLLAASSNEDVLVGLSLDERNVMWVYRWYWVGTEKMQSAWSTWTFDTGTTLLSAGIIGTVVYIVIERNGEVFLEKMDLQGGLKDTGLDFKVHLDRRADLTGVYDVATNLTTWTLPYTDSGALTVVRGASFTKENGAAVLNTTRPTTSTIEVSGDESAGVCYVGRSYTMRYRFSEQFLKESADPSSPSMLTGFLTVHEMNVVFTDSGSFGIEVTVDGRSTNRIEHDPVLGSQQFIIGKPYIASGILRASVGHSSKQITVDIVNDSYFPSNLQSGEWIGSYAASARRA